MDETANLPGGTYRFTASTDDGMRVWIDNVMIIDAWFDSQVQTIMADVFWVPVITPSSSIITKRAAWP